MRDLSGFTDDELLTIIDARDAGFDLAAVAADRQPFALATFSKLESVYFARSADTPSANGKAQHAPKPSFPHRYHHHPAAHAAASEG